VEIPRRRSTTGESPLYDLRFRWRQARHIATLQCAGLSQRSLSRNSCRQIRQVGVACCFDNYTEIIRIRALI
jgi:hypothetical protein